MPRPQRCHDPNIARHWEVLKRLAATPRGYSVKELAAATGVSLKSIRRDLNFLQKLGYDLEETVERRGRNRWRIRHQSQPNQEHYRSIQALLDTAIVEAEAIGDRRLARTLTAARDRVRAR